MRAILVLVASFVAVAYSYMPSISRVIVRSPQESTTTLFAHHPEKKIIKKIMDRRPIKHRLSDINRKNVNINKCITKLENSPSDYTIISASEFEAAKSKSNDFWKNGAPGVEWIEITAEDMQIALPQYTEETKPYVAPKRTGLIKSGTRFQKA